MSNRSQLAPGDFIAGGLPYFARGESRCGCDLTNAPATGSGGGGCTRQDGTVVTITFLSGQAFCHCIVRPQRCSARRLRPDRLEPALMGAVSVSPPLPRTNVGPRGVIRGCGAGGPPDGHGGRRDGCAGSRRTRLRRCRHHRRAGLALSPQGK
jgi:hypothetical protein